MAHVNKAPTIPTYDTASFKYPFVKKLEAIYSLLGFTLQPTHSSTSASSRLWLTVQLLVTQQLLVTAAGIDLQLVARRPQCLLPFVKNQLFWLLFDQIIKSGHGNNFWKKLMISTGQCLDVLHDNEYLVLPSEVPVPTSTRHLSHTPAQGVLASLANQDLRN